MAAAPDHVQRDQPPGVAPLHLTGERTLPDVPAENYWFQRHLVAYRWVAERCRGLDAIDMACGEGYGLDALARRAAHVVGVEANPEAFEHARARYSRPGVRVARDVVERMADRTPDGVSCSVGVTAWTPGESPDTLVDRADRALYAAKAAGRSRTVAFPDARVPAITPA